MKLLLATVSKRRDVYLLALALLALTGCSSGGGEGGGVAQPAPSSNWDSMVWDQGNWS